MAKHNERSVAGTSVINVRHAVLGQPSRREVLVTCLIVLATGFVIFAL